MRRVLVGELGTDVEKFVPRSFHDVQDRFNEGVICREPLGALIHADGPTLPNQQDRGFYANSAPPPPRPG